MRTRLDTGYRPNPPAKRPCKDAFEGPRVELGGEIAFPRVSIHAAAPRLFFTLPLALCLASCGPKVVEVKIPVTVGCVKASDIPAIPAPIAKQLTGNAAQDITPLAISALELRAALNTAVALLNACTIEGSEQ